MKTIKRISCLLLALALMMALSVTAFAANHTYEVYQIFTGDYSDGVLSNVKWGKNGTGTEGQAVSDTTLKELEAVADSAPDTEQLAVINKYANLKSNPYTTGTTTKFENLPNGYYLVKDQDGTQNVENGYYTLYIVKVVNGTLEFNPKGDVPETEKKILDTDPVDVNEASIGDTVKYQITGTLPTNLDDYNTYYYVFSDTLSKGLTYTTNSVAVKVDGVDVTSYFYINASTYNETTGTTITIGIQDIKALNNVSGVTVNKDSQIVVTYSATLNENAVIAGTGNPNDVKLSYSNNPNNSGDGTTQPPPENPGEPNTTYPTGETPKDTVVTFTTELTILKNDEANNILTGAEFTLTGSGVNVVLVTTEKFTEAIDGEYWKLKDGTYTKTAPSDSTSDKYAELDTKYAKTIELVAKDTNQPEVSAKGTVDSETGLVTFTGLGAGTYTITETKTPAGYNTIEPVTFTITFDTANKTFVSDNTKVVVGTDNKLDTTIVNKAGATLPETGSIGTTIFYVLGSVLLVGAAVLLITKKRMSAEK